MSEGCVIWTIVIIAVVAGLLWTATQNKPQPPPVPPRRDGGSSGGAKPPSREYASGKSVQVKQTEATPYEHHSSGKYDKTQETQRRKHRQKYGG